MKSFILILFLFNLSCGTDCVDKKGKYTEETCHLAKKNTEEPDEKTSVTENHPSPKNDNPVVNNEKEPPKRTEVYQATTIYPKAKQTTQVPEPNPSASPSALPSVPPAIIPIPQQKAAESVTTTSTTVQQPIPPPSPSPTPVLSVVKLLAFNAFVEDNLIIVSITSPYNTSTYKNIITKQYVDLSMPGCANQLNDTIFFTWNNVPEFVNYDKLITNPAKNCKYTFKVEIFYKNGTSHNEIKSVTY